MIKRVSDDLKMRRPAGLAAKAIAGGDDTKSNTLRAIVISNAALRAPLSSEQLQFMRERIPIWLQKDRSAALRGANANRSEDGSTEALWDERLDECYLERAEPARVVTFALTASVLTPVDAARTSAPAGGSLERLASMSAELLQGKCCTEFHH